MKKISHYINNSLNNTFLLSLVSFFIFNFKKNLRLLNLFDTKKNIKILNIGQVHSPHYVSLSKSRLHYLNKRKLNFKIYDICSYPIVNKRKIFDYNYYDYIDYSYYYKVNIKDWYCNLILNAQNNLKPVLRKINSVISTYKPDMIWIHDLQSGGYLLNEIKYLNKNCRIVLTVYGNDLYLYKDKAEHIKKIVKLLSIVDCLHVETIRDFNLAREFGYCGKIAKISSATLKVLKFNSKYPNERENLLMIRGSLGYKNRTNLTGLINFLSKSKNLIYKKNVVMYCASPENIIEFKKISQKYNFKMDFYETLTSDEIKNIYKNSSYHITATLSDGVANSCVEAVEGGCIPIITNHNGFSELIDERYKELLVYDIKFEKLYDNLLFIENNLNIKRNIISTLTLSINNYFSIESTEQALSDIFDFCYEK